MNKSLSKLWWLWLPLFIMAFNFIVEIFCTLEQKTHMLQEGGYHENFQALVMIGALVFAISLILKVENKWLKIWFLLAALGSFYVAGEELSWGQWIFEWQTPAAWSQVNDQHETNLHNTSSWFDQKPFNILAIGVLVGGIIVPTLQKFKSDILPLRFHSIYADYRVMPTSLIALALKLSDTYSDAYGVQFFWRVQEILELYIYYFVFVYLRVMKDKYRLHPELMKAQSTTLSAS